MSWNYRVVRKTFPYDGHEEFGIYSVYYDEDGKVDGMSIDPASIHSYSVEELEETLKLMKECLQKPVLDYGEPRLTPEEFMRVPIERAELVDGRVVELPYRMLGDAVTVGNIGAFLFDHIKEKNLGRVAAGGSFLTAPANVRIPAFSFLSNADLEGENTDEIIRKAPTLAVEVISQNDTYGDVDDKASEFLRAGSKAVWIVNPRRRTVAVHTPDNIAVTYQVGDAIPGGEILPGFSLPIADIFED